MIEQTVQVVEQDGYYVWVESESGSVCGSCSSKAGCGTSVLGGLFKQSRNRLRVIDYLNLRVGEQAVLGIHELDLVKAAFFAYLIPVLIMIGTSVSTSSYGFSDTIVILFSMLSLVGGFMLVQTIGNRLPGGLVTVRLLRRAPGAMEHRLQFINLERNSS